MKRFLQLLLFLFYIQFTYSQTVTINGFVSDVETGENIISAAVYDQISHKRTVTNNSGFYSLSFKKGNQIKITASYPGYQTNWKTFVLNTDTTIHFQLRNTNAIERVEISAQKEVHQNSEISTLTIPLDDIKKMPTLTGETDVMKVFQLMPGIQSGQEGSTNLYVRGGSQDQNLFLLDDVPLYYVNHLGGFVSVFDDNAINSMKLIKGGFPARYGGRLSSVIDICMKNGNNKELHGEAKFGLLSSKLFFEGPIKKNKTSFMLSARRSNIDYFTRLQTKLAYDDFIAAYTFYDVYGKLHHTFSDKSSVFFTIYSGRDRFSLIDKENPMKDPLAIDNTESYNYESYLFNKWGNQILAFRWNKIFGSRFFSNFSLSYSRFYYKNEQEYLKKDSSLTHTLEENYKLYRSGIFDFTGRIDFEYYPRPSHKFKFGANAVRHGFVPGITQYREVSQIVEADTAFGNKQLNTFELNAYIEDDFKIGKRIITNAGVLYSYYDASGIVYQSFQPRISLNLRLFDNISIKSAYSKIRQNLHLLSSSGTGIPADIWLPPSTDLKPQLSNQYVAGIMYTNPRFNTEISIEGFYKEMFHLIDFKEGASFQLSNTDWLSIVEPDGYGRAYGTEFLLQRKRGKMTGWIAYTLSKNERKFEHINSGNFYPATYDRRHDIAVVINYKLNKRITLSGNWVYSSGNMMTLAVSQYPITLPEWDDGSCGGYISNEIFFNKQIETAYYYGGKNNFRLPAYHRLDISASFEKQKKRGVRTWNVAVYNVYFRKNIYFLYYKNKGKDLYKFTLFPFVPSFSYSFRF